MFVCHLCSLLIETVTFTYTSRFARNADNGEMVMQAARHYWNASLPLINQPIERELLKDPLSMMLECITDTTDKAKYRKDDEVCFSHHN